MRPATLAQVDRWYRCTGCGYIALSFPIEDLRDDDGEVVGAESHRCPVCREMCWQAIAGLGRTEREAIAAGGAR